MASDSDTALWIVGRLLPLMNRSCCFLYVLLFVNSTLVGWLLAAAGNVSCLLLFAGRHISIYQYLWWLVEKKGEQEICSCEFSLIIM
jgi:hypothetical protein